MAQRWSTVCALVVALSAFVHYDGAFATTIKTHDFPGLFYKHGDCPVTTFPIGPCPRLCTNDFQCPGVEKCCLDNCGGHKCMKPRGIGKPGFCPHVDGPSACVDLCGHDDDCPGIQKCCKTCGTACMEPVLLWGK